MIYKTSYLNQLYFSCDIYHTYCHQVFSVLGLYGIAETQEYQIQNHLQILIVTVYHTFYLGLAQIFYFEFPNSHDLIRKSTPLICSLGTAFSWAIVFLGLSCSSRGMTEGVSEIYLQQTWTSPGL